MTSKSLVAALSSATAFVTALALAACGESGGGDVLGSDPNAQGNGGLTDPQPGGGDGQSGNGASPTVNY